MTGRQLKLMRQSKDIKQHTIAELLNVTQSFISRVEGDKRTMKKEKIEQYKQFLENYIVE